MKYFQEKKFSGFDWLGDIPKHWILTKNRYGFEKKSNGFNQSNDTPVLSLTIEGIQIKKDLTYGKSTESYIGHQLVKKGDIVFTPRDFDQTPILSDVSEYDGCISNLYIVDETKGIVLNHFVNYYWYGLKYSVDYFKNFSHGMRYSFNRFQFDEIPLLIPPLTEQLEIVQFLDERTDIINKLISLKRRKSELLKELIVSYNFYRYKSSDFEICEELWFQRKPTNWKVLKLKDIFEVISDKNHPEKRLLSVHQIKGVIYRDEQESEVMNPTGDVSNYKLVKPGDFIISLRSFEGGFEYSEVEGLVSPVYSVLRPKFQLDTIFYKFLFKTPNFIIELNRFIKGIRDGKNINFVDIKDIPVPIPSKYYDTIHNIHEGIYQSFSSDRKMIEILKEYRQSLISEIVLGKIDIRKN